MGSHNRGCEAMPLYWHSPVPVSGVRAQGPTPKCFCHVFVVVFVTVLRQAAKKAVGRSIRKGGGQEATTYTGGETGVCSGVVR